MIRYIRIPALLLLILMMISPSCQKKKSITGKAFIKREVLVDVLVDLHLVDGVTNDRKFSRKYDADSIDILSPILEKYQVTREMFDTTITTYSQHPELFDQVYNDVLIKLNVMLDENDKKTDPEVLRKEQLIN
ncbi:MAG: DUF4296 domain-containing protein [Bacteroidales bacterium]|nr:DUF4296 domain-containing protein [Bacteroidales bacterium]